jgi:integrase
MRVKRALDLKQLLSGNEKAARLAPATRLAMAALLYTGTRTAALLNAKWDAVDLAGATWTVPVADLKLTAEARKKARPFAVPLCPTAVAIFERLRREAGESPWVVTSPVERPDDKARPLDAKSTGARLSSAPEEWPAQLGAACNRSRPAADLAHVGRRTGDLSGHRREGSRTRRREPGGGLH